VSSAVSVCSIGSGGSITDDAEMSAWLDSVSPPATIELLGHELRRDALMRCEGLLVAYVCWIGNVHGLFATRYADGWCVTLARLTAPTPSATGKGASLDEATHRMLSAADQCADELGIEAVLRLRLIGGAR
jgi:hypothetical protein